MRIRVVAAGLPAMYAEARDLLGRSDALRVVVGAGLCLVLAAVRAGGRPRTQNALRHFAWSAWLAAQFGADAALELTAEHEEHSLDPLDSEADMRNNAVGRRYGRLHVDELAGLLAPVAVWHLVGVGAHKWRRGRLWAVRHGRVESSRPRIRTGA